jgi:hypothetical protein
LRDNPAGNAQGWNPNGATTTFEISEPAIGTTDGTYVGINLKFAGNVVCIVSGTNTGLSFSLACITAPPETAELHYVVDKLPPHLF